MFKGRRYWIIGASQGLGAALARALDARGADLVLSARNGEKLAALAGDLRAAEAVPMDVSDPTSVATAAERAGDVDGMVYSVGQYEPMKAADWDVGTVEAICDVNFLGGMRVLGHVVPGFVARDRGHIVMIGSLSGFRGLPGATGYGSSKAGLMNAAESLYADLRKTGVKVQLVNPGFIRTRLTEKNAFKMPFIMSAEQAADHVMRAMERGGFQTSFPRPFSWIFTAGRFLPASIFHRIIQ